MEHHTNDDGIKGLNGRVFEGKNGNQLFFPAAGYRSNSNVYSVGSNCGLWPSSLNLNDPSCIYILGFNSDGIGMYINNRYWGMSIRPVINL
jgi:hypothetical protein